MGTPKTAFRPVLSFNDAVQKSQNPPIAKLNLRNQSVSSDALIGAASCAMLSLRFARRDFFGNEEPGGKAGPETKSFAAPAAEFAPQGNRGIPRAEIAAHAVTLELHAARGGG